MAALKGKFAWLTAAFLWRTLLALVVLAMFGLLGLLWFSGARETREAAESGRRLLINIATGEIVGSKQEEQAPPKETAPAATPEANPEEKKPEEKPAEAPAAPQSEAAPAPKDTAAADLGEEPVVVSPQQAVTPVLAEADAAMPARQGLAGVNNALLEKVAGGALPIIGPDGTKPWRYYARPFSRKGSQPMIAIIVSGLGSNKLVTDNALRLPEAVTLSFSPYAHDVSVWSTGARAGGHELLLDLPMEPSNYPVSDPGPYGLIAAKGPQENETRLQWIMMRMPAYAGFLTPQNEAFSGSSESFRLLLQSLSNRGLLLIVGRQPAKSETTEILESSTTPNTVADVLIDEDLSPSAIQARLAMLEDLAKKRGYAIGVAQPFPITIEQLRQWSEKLAEKGIVLAPVSAVVRLKFT